MYTPKCTSTNPHGVTIRIQNSTGWLNMDQQKQTSKVVPKKKTFRTLGSRDDIQNLLWSCTIHSHKGSHWCRYYKSKPRKFLWESSGTNLVHVSRYVEKCMGNWKPRVISFDQIWDVWYLNSEKTWIGFLFVVLWKLYPTNVFWIIVSHHNLFLGCLWSSQNEIQTYVQLSNIDPETYKYRWKTMHKYYHRSWN